MIEHFVDVKKRSPQIYIAVLLYRYHDFKLKIFFICSTENKNAFAFDLFLPGHSHDSKSTVVKAPNDHLSFGVNSHILINSEHCFKSVKI